MRPPVQVEGRRRGSRPLGSLIVRRGGRAPPGTVYEHAAHDESRALSVEQALAGVDASLANAARFRRLAPQVGEFDGPMGVFIALTRVEKISKAAALQEIVDGKVPSDWKQFWRRVHLHHEKWAEFKLAIMTKEVIGWAAEQREQVLRAGAKAESKLREQMLYVGWTGDGWRSPRSEWREQVPHCLLLGDQLAVEHWGLPIRG